MKKITFSPTKEALMVFALGIPLYLALYYFTSRGPFFDRQLSVVGFIWTMVLVGMTLISLYFLTKKPVLTIDEKGINQTGVRPVSVSWDEIQEVKNYRILPQDFIAIRMKKEENNKSRWVYIYVRPYSAGADVLVNFMRDMANLPADQRPAMMHNLDWVMPV